MSIKDFFGGVAKNAAPLGLMATGNPFAIAFALAGMGGERASKDSNKRLTRLNNRLKAMQAASIPQTRGMESSNVMGPPESVPNIPQNRGVKSPNVMGPPEPMPNAQNIFSDPDRANALKIVQSQLDAAQNLGVSDRRNFFSNLAKDGGLEGRVQQIINNQNMYDAQLASMQPTAAEAPPDVSGMVAEYEKQRDRHLEMAADPNLTEEEKARHRSTAETYQNWINIAKSNPEQALKDASEHASLPLDSYDAGLARDRIDLGIMKEAGVDSRHNKNMKLKWTEHAYEIEQDAKNHTQKDEDQVLAETQYGKNAVKNTEDLYFGKDGRLTQPVWTDANTRARLEDLAVGFERKGSEWRPKIVSEFWKFLGLDLEEAELESISAGEAFRLLRESGDSRFSDADVELMMRKFMAGGINAEEVSRGLKNIIKAREIASSLQQIFHKQYVDRNIYDPTQINTIVYNYETARRVADDFFREHMYEAKFTKDDELKKNRTFSNITEEDFSNILLDSSIYDADTGRINVEKLKYLLNMFVEPMRS